MLAWHTPCTSAAATLSHPLPGDNFKGKPVKCLAYEAYTSGAVAHMQRLALDTLASSDVQHVELAHRVGVVPAGEPSLLVACSSCHRADCQDQTSKLINLIKAGTPVWKKEVYDDGSTSWKQNCECTAAAHALAASTAGTSQA